jgi:hypothetical protein
MTLVLQIQIHVRVQKEPKGKEKGKEKHYIHRHNAKKRHHMPRTMPIFVQSILCEMVTVEMSG